MSRAVRITRLCNQCYDLFKKTVTQASSRTFTTGTLHSQKTGVFRPLVSNLDTTSAEYLQNYEASGELETKYKDILRVVHAGGGEKAVARHTEKHRKILARDRVQGILDEDGDFLELCPLAGMGMQYGDVPGAGIVAGIGRVHGNRCVITANDATVKGGTLYPIGVRKQLRVQAIAQQNGLPCIYVVDSGGAFLPLQSEIFIPGGRTFYNEAVMSSMNIPQVAVVCGSCTAGGAYVPTMADEAVIVHRIGTIFLGGPPLVQAATGEVVSAENLGGATLHSSVSGCTDYFASTEQEGFEMCRDIVASLNLPNINRPSEYEMPLYNSEHLAGIASVEPGKCNIYEVLAHIADGSRFHEFKARFGSELITGFSYVQGYLVGLLGNNGPLTEEAALKGAHFVQLCTQRNIPLVFLQDSPNDVSMATSAEEADIHGSALRGHGKLMAAVACSSVPKITFILGGSFGALNYAMGGRSFEPNFLFSWPTAQIGILPPDELERQITESSYPSYDPNNSEQKEFKDKLTKQISVKSSPFYASSNLWDDGIILPQDTRKVLGQCLEIVNQPKLSSDTATPFFRM